MGKCEREPSEELLRAVDLFNQGNWLGCHEKLERLWSDETGEVRYFYQGIIQVGAAVIQWSRGKFGAVLQLLESGTRILSEVHPDCQGIDVAALIADADRLRQAMQHLGPERLAELDRAAIPKLKLVK